MKGKTSVKEPHLPKNSQLGAANNSQTWTLAIDVPGADEECKGADVCELVLPRGHLVVGHAFPVTHQRRGR